MDDLNMNRRMLRLAKNYEKRCIEDENTGKQKTVIVYVGLYYCLPFTQQQLAKLKAVYFFLLCAGILFFVPAAIAKEPVNNLRYTAFIQVLWLMGALICFCCMVMRLTIQADMTEKEYRWASVHFKRSAALSAGAAAAALLCVTFSSVRSGIFGFRAGRDLLLYLLSGCCFLTLTLLERRMPYTKRASEGGANDVFL